VKAWRGLAFTEQQKRIIKLLGRDLSATEIATALGLTTAEVETELEAIANQFTTRQQRPL